MVQSRVLIKQRRLPLIISLSLTLGLWGLLSATAHALPGQSVEEAITWIQANTTLRPRPGEKLMVRKSGSAAQRFIFEASLYPPGNVAPGTKAGGQIRSERFQLFDMQNGVTQARLEESLRVIYGLDILHDYSQAEPIYTYPTTDDIQTAIVEGKPLLDALQGEVRRGTRYAYWMEIAQDASGKAYAGRITVFLLEDLEKLVAEVRLR
jgi:hypothetical protein